MSDGGSTDDAMNRAEETARQGARQARQELAGLGRSGEGEAPARGIELLGRVGLVGYALVHVIIGVIALQIAATGGGQADQQGALGALAGQPYGAVLIVVVIVGLAAFAVWQGLAAATGFRWTSGGTRLRKRLDAGGRTVAVLAIAAIGVRVLVTGSSGSSSAGSQRTTADLLALPAGWLLVVGVGVVVLGVAVATGVTGVRRTFSEDVDYGRLPSRLRRPVELAGVVGHVARAVAFGIVGVLFGVAGLRADPLQAGGLDAALKTLAAQPYGVVLLLVVALGVVAHGLFLFAEAWARKV